MTELAPGAQLGKYTLERLLGSGGMGAVWLANDPDLDRKVALKVLRPGYAGEVASERLLREARAMARLRHPNVITVFEASSAAGRDFVAMELVDGAHMAAWLATGEHATAEIVATLLAAGRGLAAAHAAGLIHRDFKPHNVLVEKGGRVLVTDFGLARADSDGEPRPNPSPTGPERPSGARDDGDASPSGKRDDMTVAASPSGKRDDMTATASPSGKRDDMTVAASPSGKRDDLAATASPSQLALDQTAVAPSSPVPTPAAARSSERGALDSPLTIAGVVLGTPAYMAPEQMRGDRAGARADQFAFAVTAWEALAGARPFAGETMIDIAKAIETQPPADASRIPRRLRAILERALAKDPRDRWASMDHLLVAIERAWRRPRRIAIAAAALVPVPIIAMIAMRSDPPAKPTLCTDPTQATARIWSPIIRAQWRALLPPDTAARVVGAIDAWTESWSSRFAANCAKPGDPDHAARQLCFDTQLEDVAFVLGSPDVRRMQMVSEAEPARVLPFPESCVRAPRAIAPALPADPALRKRVIDLRNRLLSLRSHERGGVDQTATADTLVAEARALDVPPILADALASKAVMLQLAAPPVGKERVVAMVAAYHVFAEAVELAEAAGYDRIRNESLIGQIECAPFVTDPQVGADELIRRADAAIKRVADPGQRNMLEGLRVQHALMRGLWTEAIEHADRARDGWRALGAMGSAALDALHAADARSLRHHDGDLEQAAATLHEYREYASPRFRDAYLATEAQLAWQLGRLDDARRLYALAGIDDPTAAGTSGGGTIDGVVTGTPPILDDTDTMQIQPTSNRLSLPWIAIADATHAWALPVNAAGAFHFEHVPPGEYTVTAVSSTAAVGLVGVRTRARVSEGRATNVSLAFAAPARYVTNLAATTRIALPASSTIPSSTATLEAQLANAAWFGIIPGDAPGFATLRAATAPFIECTVSDAIADETGSVTFGSSAEVHCDVKK